MPMGKPFPSLGSCDSVPFSELLVVSSTGTTLRLDAFVPLSDKHLDRLTVRLLEAGTSTGTTELLGLAAAVVGNEEGSVELDKSLLQEVLGVLVDELLVVGDEGLGDSLSNSIDLRYMPTAIYFQQLATLQE